jgi:mono/diheme cytochrome c family protein
MLTVSMATTFTSRAKAMNVLMSLTVICLVAVLGVGPAAAAEPASGAAVNSLKEIRETLDAGKKLLDEGKPGKAAARVAEASQAIEAVAAEGTAPTAGLRSLWERCRSLRNDLELEGADVSGISPAPLKMGAAKASSSKAAAGKPAGKPVDTAAPAAGAAKPVAAAQPAAKPALTFTAQVAPILSRHCGGCHIAGRKGGFQMVSYAGLMKTGMVQPGVGESSRLVEVILSGDMPRGGGKVSPEDLGVLMKWIDVGAPFDGPDPTAPIDGLARQATAPPPAVAPTKPIVAVKLKAGDVSFAADVAPVLLEQCAGCHDAMQPEANLSMVTLERLLRGGRGGSPVVSGKGAESLLIKKLKGTGIEGQRMPLGKPPLADDVIALIQKWIDQGATLDLLTPKADLETLTAAGRSQKLSHDDLKKVRFQTASSLWTRAIPDEKPVVIDRGDVLVVANLSAAKSEELANTAEAVEGRLREEVMGGKPPLVKGGIVAYGFAKGYDLSSFWQTAFSDDRPKGVTAGAGVLGDVVYAAVVPPGGGKSSGEKPSAGKHNGQADASALLAEQMTTAALLGRGVPAWFAKGAGRAVAMKFEPKADLVETWRRDLPAAVQRGGSPADFFGGRGDPVAMATVGGGFIAAIMPSVSRLEALVAQLDAGTPFDQAFASVFRGQPQPLFEAWAAQQAARGPRR